MIGKKYIKNLIKDNFQKFQKLLLFKTNFGHIFETIYN